MGEQVVLRGARAHHHIPRNPHPNPPASERGLGRVHSREHHDGEEAVERIVATAAMARVGDRLERVNDVPRRIFFLSGVTTK